MRGGNLRRCGVERARFQREVREREVGRCAGRRELLRSGREGLIARAGLDGRNAALEPLLFGEKRLPLLRKRLLLVVGGFVYFREPVVDGGNAGGLCLDAFKLARKARILCGQGAKR